MSAPKKVRGSRGGRRFWLMGATLVVAAAFGVIFVAATGAAPPTCPTPGNFEIDGDMNQNTCTPPANDWDTPNIGVQQTTQGGTYSTSGKDNGNPSTWSSSGSTPDKTNFAQAYATSRVVNGDFYVFVAWERTSTTGTQGYAIEITNSGANVGADGTPQPIRSGGGSVFYISSQGSSAPAFNSACAYTSQSNYGTTCQGDQNLAGVTMAINTAQISDPLNGTTQPAGGFFEVALDISTLTGIHPSCPGPSAASVYLRSITGQTSNGNLKGYMAPLNVAPDSTCVPPPITTTANPGGSTAAIGSSQHDDVTVSDGTNVGVGSVKFFLCTPAQVTANGGDCKANGTQVGTAKTLDGNGQASSDSVDGTTTPNTNTPGKYCWRAEFTPSSGDHHFLAGSHTNSTTECFTVVPNSPTIVTTPSPKTVTLPPSGVLKDSAVLVGGYNPTGTITFTLVYKGSTVDTETVTVNGNGTYATPVGYTLPSSGTVTGTYQWNATYSGDSNNNSASELNDASERVTVGPASPSIVTTPNPTSVTLGTSPVTLKDSAVLSGGSNPSGTITFTLVYKGATVDTETVLASGNGTYSTPVGYTLPTSGTVTGTYQWNATYSGDGNNSTVSENGSVDEQVTVNKAGPSVVTTASPNGTVTLDDKGSPTLNDSAVLSGGYGPTGTITFTLKHGASAVYTDVVTVSGNGTYTTAAGNNPGGYQLPTSGTVTGSYVWTATYSGDGNNNTANDPGTSAAEQVNVAPAAPSIVTTPNPTSAALGTGTVTLKDSAVLSGGYHPTGSITFTLVYKGATVDTETVSVSGNGTYSTPVGYTLPGSGTVTGTYQWNATYTGDGNNNTVSENNSVDEQVTVNSAGPSVVTTATPHGTVTLDDKGSPTLNDSAALSGGNNPTGTITFTLKHGATTVYTDVVTVSGNGTYTTAAGNNPGGYTLPGSGTVTGSYVWTATYSGDGNNTTANDPGTSDLEQANVAPASPTIVTTASPNGTVTLDDKGSPTLNDSAVLAGGYHPTGTITFTLKYNGTTVYTDHVSVSGNATYSTSAGDVPGGYQLPASGTVTGSYVWTAVYGGDTNNNSATDPGTSAAEQVQVNKAGPSVVTTATPHGTVTLDDKGSPTLNDSAALSGGYNPTGTITFTLKHGATTVYTDVVTVSGNGTYTTAAGTNAGGYQLPTSGTVTGSYVWTATYSGDGNNTTATDPGTSDLEQVTVNKANPSIVTTPNPTSVTLGKDAELLKDSAVLSGGYHPTGSITFTLVYKGSTVDTETVSVSGNGTYTTPTGYTLPSSGTVTGTYQWNATYTGDTNNNAVSENNSADEQVTVNPASPNISTTPSETAGSVNDLLNDTAHLSNGVHFDGNGTITFNLYGPGDPNCDGKPAYTETVKGVDHNGDYSTSNSTVLADSAGIWNWTATFNGDSNNSQALSGCGEEEVGIDSPVIHIKKTADKAQVNAGDDIGFTMTVWNSGSGDARGVTLTDPLPTNPGTSWSVDSAGTGFGSGADCSISQANVLTCGPETVPALGSQQSSTFWVHITSHTDKTTGGDCKTTGLVDNTGSVTTSNDGSDSSKAEICVAKPVIHIVKTADKAQVNAGDDVGFTMTVWNSGNGDAKNVTLTDQLPTNPGLVWSVDSAGAGFGGGTGPDCSIAAGVLTCGPETVAAGGDNADSSTSPFWVHITSHTTKDTGGDCTGTSGVVDNTGDVSTSNDGSDSSEAKICVAPANVSITKTADHTAPVHAGDAIGFTVEVKNTGTGTATGVELSDPLPAGSGSGVTWAIDSSVGTPGQFVLSGPKGSQTLSLDSSTLPAGADYKVHITAQTSETECSTYDNTATLTTENANNPEPVSAEESCAFRVDLSVTKTGSPATQELGTGNITWTMVVTNNGPDIDTNVVVADPMPAGNTFVSATTTKGSCTGGAILNCSLGTMAAGESVTITLVTTPSQEGPQTNTVKVVGDRPEANTANNTATATVQVTGPHTPPAPCIAVSKVTPTQLFVGRKTTLTIHVTQGGNAVKGIHVRITGPKIDLRTKASNGKGVIKHTLKMKKAGILIFSPIASKRCNTQRVGVTNVFTPPVTG